MKIFYEIESGSLVRIRTTGGVHASLDLDEPDLYDDSVFEFKEDAIYIAITWLTTLEEDFVYVVFPEAVGWIHGHADDVILALVE